MSLKASYIAKSLGEWLPSQLNKNEMERVGLYVFQRHLEMSLSEAILNKTPQTHAQLSFDERSLNVVYEGIYCEIKTLIKESSGREDDVIQKLSDPKYLEENSICEGLGLWVRAYLKDIVSCNKTRSQYIFFFNPKTVSWHWETQDTVLGKYGLTKEELQQKSSIEGYLLFNCLEDAKVYDEQNGIGSNAGDFALHSFEWSVSAEWIEF